MAPVALPLEEAVQATQRHIDVCTELKRLT